MASSGSQTYQYNTRNQLYGNGTGQLFYRGPSGELGQTPGMNYDWVNGQLATEGNGTIQRRYVYGPGSDEPLVWYEGSGTSDRRYLGADERGSIVEVTNDAGNALAVNTYDEYGVPGPSNLGRFQYTGQAWLPELGLYDYKARMYSPTLGRFLQPDPIGYGDGLNWYNYVGADPVNFTDPTGLQQGDLVVTGPLCPNGFHHEKDQGDERGCVADRTFSPNLVANIIDGGGGVVPDFSSYDPTTDPDNDMYIPKPCTGKTPKLDGAITAANIVTAGSLIGAVVLSPTIGAPGILGPVAAISSNVGLILSIAKSGVLLVNRDERGALANLIDTVIGTGFAMSLSSKVDFGPSTPAQKAISEAGGNGAGKFTGYAVGQLVCSK